LDPADQIDQRLALNEAVQLLEELPPRLRRIAFMRAVGMSYDEITEITGDSKSRLSALVSRANDRTYEALERRRADDRDAPPRARRLRMLTRAPAARSACARTVTPNTR
jgi:DNA-directed RNA polymerase specialized sigma24 family protein